VFIGPLAALAILVAPPPAGLDPAAWRTLAVAALMAIWWATEALPVAATALLPLALFPLLGIMNIGSAAAPYANPLIYLFLGGFLMALAVERWNLHRRVALHILVRAGTAPRALLAGFMGATALLSMWINNSATTIMMLPVALAVVRLIRLEAGPIKDFAPTLMLSVAYAASIGGIATLVGTPPNALLAGFLEQTYGVEIGFARWMLFGVPTSLALLAAVWLILALRVGHAHLGEDVGTLMRAELRELGPFTGPERRVAVIFLSVALLWIVRPMVADAFGLPLLSDEGIAIVGALLMFLVPAKEGEFLLDWETARKVPWEVLILFGGGLSLAAAINQTGLALWFGGALSPLVELPTIVLVLGVTALIIFLTELTSNTATTAAFLPVVGAVAIEIGLSPLALAAPATVAASCAFMLPVATPPNAIVYGTGHVTIPQMMRAGLALNIAGIVIVTLTSTWFLPLVADGPVR